MGANKITGRYSRRFFSDKVSDRVSNIIESSDLKAKKSEIRF